MIRVLFFVLSLVLIAAPATAQHMDKEAFLRTATGGEPNSRAFLMIYLQGTLNGLESANMELVRRGDPKLFCVPPDRILRPDWLIAELIAYLDRYPDIPDNTSIAVIAGLALQDIFACERRL